MDSSLFESPYAVFLGCNMEEKVNKRVTFKELNIDDVNEILHSLHGFLDTKSSQEEDESMQSGDHKDESIEDVLDRFSYMVKAYVFDEESQVFFSVIDVCNEIMKMQPSRQEEKKNKRKTATQDEEKYIEVGFNALKTVLQQQENKDFSYSVVLKSLVDNFVDENLNRLLQPTLDFIVRVADIDRDSFNRNIYLLIQTLCFKASDSTPARQHLLPSIIKLSSILADNSRTEFASFLKLYSKNKRPAYRLFAVEIMNGILETILKEIPLDGDYSIFRTINYVLLERCTDKIANIRTKALSSIGNVMKTIFIDYDAPNLTPIFLEYMFHKGSEPTTPRKNDRLQAKQRSDSLIDIVRARLLDEKSNVQRAALSVLEVIGRCSISDIQLTDGDIMTLKDACFDSYVSIRKQAATTLSELVIRFPESKKLNLAWSSCIPNLAFDTEQSIQDLSLKYFDKIVIQRIEERNISTLESTYVWDIVEKLGNCYSGTRSTLSKLLLMHYDKSKPSTSLISSVKNIIKNENHVGAWILISNLSLSYPKLIDASLVKQKWDNIGDSNDQLKTKILSTLIPISVHLKTSDKVELKEDIVFKIGSYSFEPTSIKLAVSLITKIHDDWESWFETIYSDCSNVLANVISGPMETKTSLQEIERRLLTIGEMFQYHKKVPNTLIQFIEALIAPTLKNIHVYEHNAVSIPITDSVRACAYISLGMLCLQHPNLTKTTVPKFARELEVSTSSVIRNNVMVILCNLCVRYTNAVEGYISKIALCLLDPNELVRKQTLILLSSLLQEDYIKPKNDNIFFRIILALVDESPELRKHALSCLETLQLKNDSKSNLFYNHFIETIFYLNDYKQHLRYNQFDRNKKERNSFSLKGSANKEKRMEIYRVYLEHIPDFFKLKLTFDMSKEIISAVVDKQLPLKEAEDVLFDALCVLSSKEIKIKASSIAKNENEEEEDIKEDQKKITSANTKLINQIVKKNVIENIIPSVVELKHLLAKSRSPLLKNLLDYLKEILKDYKEEIKEILECDRQLAVELEYEMNKVETDKRNEVFTCANIFSPISTPMDPRKLATPVSMGKFSVPKLRRESVPYQATPGKVSAPIEGVENIAENVIPSSNKKITRPFLVSPSVARLRQVNMELNVQNNSHHNEKDETPIKPKRKKTINPVITSKKPKVLEEETHKNPEEAKHSEGLRRSKRTRSK